MGDLDGPMNGKICMVTGATSGIGKAVARGLARQGATVIVVGRNREKSVAVVDHLKGETGNPRVEYMLADLSSQEEIRQLAQDFQHSHERLDVLVNDAGGLFATRRQSVDGIEMTFALNHLSQFLLTNLLLDSLKAGAPSRIINVTALLHKWATISFNDLENRQRYSGWRAYRESKLAIVLFTYELARRLAGTGVTANVVHPGVVVTSLGANGRFSGFARRLFNIAFRPLLISPEQAARTLIYLASSPEVESLTGKYFARQKAAQSSKASYDGEVADRLWRRSAEMTGLPIRSGRRNP